jgi:transposase
VSDDQGRLREFFLSPGNVADIDMAPPLIIAARGANRLLADKGYDANSLRTLISARKMVAVIPSKSNRKQTIPHDPVVYRERNKIERMFGRLKDYRRVATRYDKLARNYDATVALAAIVIWWIN